MKQYIQAKPNLAEHFRGLHSLLAGLTTVLLLSVYIRSKLNPRELFLNLHC